MTDPAVSTRGSLAIIECPCPCQVDGYVMSPEKADRIRALAKVVEPVELTAPNGARVVIPPLAVALHQVLSTRGLDD